MVNTARPRSARPVNGVLRERERMAAGSQVQVA
jgi:hypothetical protein